MFKGFIKFANGEIVTITAPTVETLHRVCYSINENVYVNDTLIRSKNGVSPTGEKVYWAGYTIEGLRKVLEGK